MNEEKLNKVIEKYQSGYYHDTTIYQRQPEDKTKNYLLTCDYIEIVYDLLECDIKESDIDFIYDNSLRYDKNILNLFIYIRDLELKEKNIKKALIHLGWMFILEENSWIEYFINKKHYHKLYIRSGQTYVEANIRHYEAQKEFRRICQNFDGMMKAINDDYQKQLKNKKS